MGVGCQHHASAAIPQGKNQYPLYRRLRGPQGQSGRVRKISPSPGLDPRTVQPAASRYTDFATLTPTRGCTTVFEIPRHCSLSYFTSFRSVYFVTFILISSSHLRSCSKPNRFYDRNVSWMCVVSLVNCPSYCLCSEYPNNIWRRIQITKLLTMQFCPPSCRLFLLLGSDSLRK